MRVPSPTSRTGRQVYLSLWDVCWAVGSPLVALYIRDVEILLRADWAQVGYYWALSSGLALLAFLALRIQDGMTRFFSVHEALDVAEAVVFAELLTCGAMFTLTRFDGIPRSMPLIHGVVLFAGLIAARMIFRVMLCNEDDSNQHHAGGRGDRTIVIGANRFASSFIQLLSTYAPQRQTVIAVLDNDKKMLGRAVSGVQVLGAPSELEAIITEFTIHGVNTDRVVIAGEADYLPSVVLHEVKHVCQKRNIELAFLPRMIGITEWKPFSHGVARTAAGQQPSLAQPFYFQSQALYRCDWGGSAPCAFVAGSVDSGCACLVRCRLTSLVLAGASSAGRGARF